MKKVVLLENTTRRLKGIALAEENKLWKIRHRVWYRRWEDFAGFLSGKPSGAEILKYAHRFLDGVNGYHYSHVAGSSEESLEQVIKDYKVK
jgi:hypothetical protein